MPTLWPSASSTLSFALAAIGALLANSATEPFSERTCSAFIAARVACLRDTLAPAGWAHASIPTMVSVSRPRAPSVAGRRYQFRTRRTGE
jgi:hypothetical protein